MWYTSGLNRNEDSSVNSDRRSRVVPENWVDAVLTFANTNLEDRDELAQLISSKFPLFNSHFGY